MLSAVSDVWCHVPRADVDNDDGAVVPEWRLRARSRGGLHDVSRGLRDMSDDHEQLDDDHLVSRDDYDPAVRRLRLPQLRAVRAWSNVPIGRNVVPLRRPARGLR